MEYKYKIGEKIMGRYIGQGFIDFFAGEIAEQFEGIGKTYTIKLEPGLEKRIPIHMRQDGFFILNEMYAVPFDAQKWSKINLLADRRNEHLEAAGLIYQEAMVHLS